MKKQFINDDFLLTNDISKRLYHEQAKDLPIIDYHCHLSPQQIADDINFRNLSHIWLEGDHYKWRALRACGVKEELITGNTSEKEKFLAWAETVPKTLRNPLYHWTHMELKNPFGISDRLLSPDTAESIWEECNDMLQKPEFSTRGLIAKNRVKIIGTTDDPTDSMEYHVKLKKENPDFKVVPTFRPDKGMEIGNVDEFLDWVHKLEVVTNTSINTFQDFLKALQNRHDFFGELGCKASDHGLEKPYSEPFTENQIIDIFDRAMQRKSISKTDIEVFKSAFIYYCGVMNAQKGWVMQLHIGPIRNNNSRMFKKLGRDAGFDSIGDEAIAKPLSKMLDRLDSENNLPKTILFNINPRDNELFSTMIGNFQDGSVAAKVQHGPPWWFLDQKDGIEKQLNSLSNMGILYEFVGMTTDSRSFLSYPRHDYFRRILCNMMGNEMEEGLIPDDYELVADYVERICYKNANNYFNF